MGPPKQRRGGVALGLAAEVPELRRRPFICAYYRVEPPRLRHLWCCHNESGNIWTHIVAALLMFVQFGFWLHSRHSEAAWSQPEVFYHAGVGVYFLGSIATFCVSAQYHFRLCTVDEDEFLRWMYWDQSSCLGLVMTGFFAGVPMGFHCFPTLQVTYIATSLLVCLCMAAALSKIPKERSKLWLIACGKGRNAIGVLFVTQIITTGIAVLFYTKFIPERFAPGRFDLIGNSHQLWHVAIYVSIALYAEVLVRVSSIIDSGTFCV